MSEIMDKLNQDHANLARLLYALERQIAVFDRSEQPDYELIAGIVDYCLTYPDLYHHPMEDLVLEALRRRAPEIAERIGNLDGQHRSLSDLAHRFAEAIHNVELGAEVSRDAIEGLAREFLDTYRTHMTMEDRYFFPAAVQHLSEEDWAELPRLLERSDDPLFDPKVETRFQRLREDLIAWDRADA